MTRQIQDSHGRIIGRFEEQGNEVRVFVRSICKGRYDKRQDKTFTHSGKYVGTGDQLTSLLKP